MASLIAAKSAHLQLLLESILNRRAAEIQRQFQGLKYMKKRASASEPSRLKIGLHEPIEYTGEDTQCASGAF